MKSPKTIAKAITLGLIASAAMTNCEPIFRRFGKSIEVVASPGFLQKVGNGLSSAKNAVLDMDNVYAVGRGFETAGSTVKNGVVTAKNFVLGVENWKTGWNAAWNQENAKSVLKNKYTWMTVGGVAGLFALYKYRNNVKGWFGKHWSKMSSLKFSNFIKRSQTNLEDEVKRKPNFAYLRKKKAQNKRLQDAGISG